VTIERGGIVTSASKGKVASDDMIKTFSGQYMDYSVVD
jgi:hypothetical protein